MGPNRDRFAGRGAVGVALLLGVLLAGCGPERLRLSELVNPWVRLVVDDLMDGENSAYGIRYRRWAFALGSANWLSTGQCEFTEDIEVAVNGRNLEFFREGVLYERDGYMVCSPTHFRLPREPFDVEDTHAFERDGDVDVVEITDGETTLTIEAVGLMVPRTVKGADGSSDPIVLEAGQPARLLWSRPSDQLEGVGYTFRFDTLDADGRKVDGARLDPPDITVRDGGLEFVMPDMDKGEGKLLIDPYYRIPVEIRSCEGLARCDVTMELLNVRFPIEII